MKPAGLVVTSALLVVIDNALNVSWIDAQMQNPAARLVDRIDTFADHYSSLRRFKS